MYPQNLSEIYSQDGDALLGAVLLSNLSLDLQLEEIGCRVAIGRMAKPTCDPDGQQESRIPGTLPL